MSLTANSLNTDALCKAVPNGIDSAYHTTMSTDISGDKIADRVVAFEGTLEWPTTTPKYDDTCKSSYSALVGNNNNSVENNTRKFSKIPMYEVKALGLPKDVCSDKKLLEHFNVKLLREKGADNCAATMYGDRGSFQKVLINYESIANAGATVDELKRLSPMSFAVGDKMLGLGSIAKVTLSSGETITGTVVNFGIPRFGAMDGNKPKPIDNANVHVYILTLDSSILGDKALAPTDLSDIKAVEELPQDERTAHKEHFIKQFRSVEDRINDLDKNNPPNPNNTDTL